MALQLIQITTEEFANYLISKMDERYEKTKTQSALPNPVVLKTREQASEFLHVDISTLHRWVKSGKIPAYGISNRVYFKEEDLINALQRII